jgi:hypothetical protein
MKTGVGTFKVERSSPVSGRGAVRAATYRMYNSAVHQDATSRSVCHDGVSVPYDRGSFDQVDAEASLVTPSVEVEWDRTCSIP